MRTIRLARPNRCTGLGIGVGTTNPRKPRDERARGGVSIRPYSVHSSPMAHRALVRFVASCWTHKRYCGRRAAAVPRKDKPPGHTIGLRRCQPLA
eukprot:8846585-Heterocapsa_arctica.AAC.1